MTAQQIAFEKKWDQDHANARFDFVKAGETMYDGKMPSVFFTLGWLAQAIHGRNQHFYKDLLSGLPIDRNPGEMIALIHSEVSEMLEGVRKGLPDDHLPHRKMEEVEAADILIRLLDYCAYRDLDIGGATWEKLEYNRTRQDHKDEARRMVGGKKF